MEYYVETSIWLNVINNEGDASKGTTWCEIGRNFLKKKKKVFYSGVVLRELQLNLDSVMYKQIRQELSKTFVRVDATLDDRAYARKLESFYCYAISFYDLVHLAIAKRIDAVLVSRDRQLLEIAKEQGVLAGRPEELQ